MFCVLFHSFGKKLTGTMITSMIKPTIEGKKAAAALALQPSISPRALKWLGSVSGREGYFTITKISMPRKHSTARPSRM